MTEAQSEEQILQLWNAAWTASHPTIPWFADNEAGVAGTSFARVTAAPAVSQQATMGPPTQRRWKRRGTIMVQLFTPIDQGAAPLATLCDDARTALEGVSVGDLTIEAGSTQKGPPDGAWNMAAVTFPYWFYETR